MTLKIDAHQHFWQLDRDGYDYTWMDAEPLAPIRRDFLPDDLKTEIDDLNVKHTVFVQTQHSVVENRWVLELAEKHSFIAGVVGWVDLASPECEDQLLEFKDHPKFVGIRHVTHDEPDDDFIVRDDVKRGLAVLQKHSVPFDLLFFPKHLRHAKTLAEEFPVLPMVIDHLAKPRIKNGAMDDWLDDFAAAAEYPNVSCKLSGMITEADWQDWGPEDLKPYVEKALELFSPERCMFGSDWPVCTLAGSYRQVFEALDFCLEGLSSGERHRILAETAVEFYGLDIGNHH
ncbi:MAG: amidohydrolase family protein [Pirellulales bacterium]|nr:amidohydrolase family protein [Pirellulales bacterium]